jgi:hypothetical protein
MVLAGAPIANQTIGPSAYLVAGYRLDGNTLDMSGNGNHGTNVNSVTFSAGKIGQAAVFDGAGTASTAKQIVIGNKALVSTGAPFTICAWAYNDAFTKAYPAIVLVCDGTEHVGISLSNQGGYLGLLSGSATRWARLKSDTEAASLTGAWIHFAVVYNGSGATTAGNFSRYINFAKVANNAAGLFAAVPKTTTIGLEASSVATLWDGMIDDVFIFSRALSSNDIVRVSQGLQPRFD